MAIRRLRPADAVLRLFGKVLSPRSTAASSDGLGSVAPEASASVRKWLLLLVACGVAGIVILAFYGKWQVGRIYDSASYANTNTVPRIVALEDARAHFTRWRMVLYRHAMGGAHRQANEMDAVIARERDALRLALDRYEAIAEGEDRQRLDIVRALMAQYERDALAAEDRLHAGQPELALSLLSANANANDRIVTELDRQIADSVSQGRAEDADALRAFTEASWTTLVFVLMVVGALLAVGYVVGRRITEQVERTRMLAQDNDMFRLMLEGTSNQSVMLHDSGAGGRVIYANAAACRHFGVDRETILNWRPKDFDPHLDAAKSARIEGVRAQGGTYTFETEHRVASGELVPVEVTINWFEHGGRVLGLAFVRDLRPQRETEVRRLEMQRLEAEHENARRLTRFAQSAPGFMFTVEQSPGGRAVMTYASPAVENIYGIGMADVLADVENIYALIVPEDLAQVLRLMEESSRKHSPFHAEYRIRHSTKGERWMEATSMPDAMEDGTVQWHGFVTDITERKAMEEQLAAREREFRMLSENSPDMIIRYDLDCRRTYVNQAFLDYTGVPAEAVLGKPISELAWWSLNVSAKEFERHLRRVMETGEPDSLRLYGNTPPAGEPRHALARIVPEYGADGRVESLLAVVRDVTDLVLAEQELRQREQYQRALLDNFPFFVWLKDTDSRLLAANRQYARVAKVATTQELVGKTDFDFFPHELATAYVEDDRSVLAEGTPKNVVEQYRDEAGQLLWMETYKSPVVVDGQMVGTVGFSRDITEKMQLQTDLASREREFRTLVEHSPDTICRYDLDGRRIYVNPKMVEHFRVEPSELLGKSPAEFPGGEAMQLYEQAIRQAFASGEAGNFELNWQNREGRRFCTHLRLMPEFDSAGGDVISVLAVGRDITEIDEYRKRVHHMAFYDALTSLPNRSLLNDRIGHTIADAAYHGHRFGLMVLDLDGFKEVNDTLGHGVGDLLLCEVGKRLLGCVRIYDTVARLGGDEFAVLLPEVRADDNLAVISRKILDALVEPFNIGGKEMFVSASIGIAMYPSDSADIDGLFRYADSAMYHAKKQGRNNFQFYSAELTARSGERMALESALRRARKNKELELYYQPQVEITSGRLIGVEALLRWNRGTHGMVTPDRFIPIAEETGLIVGIGEWVLETACEAAVAWNTGREVPLKIAVNLSTRQFLRNDLAQSVRTVLENTGCQPEWLALEITESLLLDDAEDIRNTLVQFDAMGLSIAIDDFGTGYSALGYLNRFPVGVLKIDRSFVRDITTDRDRAELVKAIISMARSLRMGLVAEGVETDAQAAYLGNLGCHVAQGYLFGKPMPRSEFEALLGKGVDDAPRALEK
jgi:diguanylate cyclase (GGDEF)-like protein/PAS domain S-box-containing protein